MPSFQNSNIHFGEKTILIHPYIKSRSWFHCRRPMCRRSWSNHPLWYIACYVSNIVITWCECPWIRQHRWVKMNADAPTRGDQITQLQQLVAKRIAIEIIVGIYMCDIYVFRKHSITSRRENEKLYQYEMWIWFIDIFNYSEKAWACVQNGITQRGRLADGDMTTSP